MSITIPTTFVTRTTIEAADVNANFTEVGTKALNRTGDTITGNITVTAGVTIDGRDISADLDQSVKTTASPSFAGLTITGTGASALDVGGGINAGTGNVAIVDATGKIPALSSTYFTSDSGANVTGLTETMITDDTILARVAADEVITGTWTLGETRVAIQRATVAAGSSTNNFAVTAGITVILITISGSGDHTITGMTGGVDGRCIIIYNTQANSNSLLLTAEGSGSTAANRYSHQTGGVGGKGWLYCYDGTASRWRTLSLEP